MSIHLERLRPVLEQGGGGWAGRLMRVGLSPLGWVVGAGARVRAKLYRAGFCTAVKHAIPVVSVGNITAGGTGKTPLVTWLARRLVQEGRRPAVVSRGYRAGGDGRNDEAALLAELVPGLVQVSHRNRNQAIAQAAAAGADVVLLDDGFQHLAAQRDLDLVLVDMWAPFGGGRVLPAGLLREPLTGLARADLIVLSRTDLVAREQLTRVGEVLDRVARGVPRCHAIHRPIGLLGMDGASHRLDLLVGASVYACCAIGQPAAFRETLLRAGARVCGLRAFPDHHHFSAADVAAVGAAARKSGASWTVMTAKDRVKVMKLLGAVKPRPPVLSLEVELDFPGGCEALLESMRRVTMEREV